MNRFRNFLSIVTFSTAPFIFLKIGSINLTIFDGLLFLIAALFFFKNFNLRSNFKNYYIFAFCFLFFAWLSTFNSVDQTMAISTNLQYTFIMLILFPTVGKMLDFELYKKIIISMSLVWCTFAIANLFLLKNPNYLWGGGAGRFVSFFSEPGEVGLLTAVMTPFLLYSFISVKLKQRTKTLLVKSIFLVGIPANLGMLIASGSRSGVVSLIVGLSLFLIMRYRLSIKLVITGIAFVVLSLVLMVNIDAERNALTRLTSGENTDARISDYKLTYAMLEEYLFLGTGLGASGTAIQDYNGSYRPHNIFLDLLIETGAPGLISISVILGLCLFFGIRIFWNVLFHKKNANLLVSATFSSGVILLVCQQFTTIANHRGYWLIWAFCLWMSTQKEYFYLDINEKLKKAKIRRRIVWK